MAQRTVRLDDVVAWIDDRADTVHLSSTDPRLDGSMKLSPRRGTATDQTLRSFVARALGDVGDVGPGWRPALIEDHWEGMTASRWANHHVTWVCGDPDIRDRGERALLSLSDEIRVLAVGNATLDKLTAVHADVMSRFGRLQAAKTAKEAQEVKDDLEPVVVLARPWDLAIGAERDAAQNLVRHLVEIGRSAGYQILVSTPATAATGAQVLANTKLLTVAGDPARKRISTADLPHVPPYTLLFRDMSGLPCYDVGALHPELVAGPEGWQLGEVTDN